MSLFHQSRSLCPGCLILIFAGAFVPIGAAQDTTTIDVRGELESAAAALDVGNTGSALKAIRAAENAEPGNPWVWFYKGRANAQRGYPHEAIAAFDRALEILTSLGDPDPPFTERIRTDRRIVHRQISNQSLLLGMAYDSNVTFRGGGTTGLFVTGTGDTKVSSEVRWDYSPIATPTERLTIGGHVSDAWHFQIGEFNYQDYGAFVRGSWSLAERWALDLQFNYDITYLGNQPFLSNNALTAGITHRFDPTGDRLELRETRIDYRIDARDFLIDTVAEFDRDGVSNSVGVSQTFRFRPSDQAATVWDIYAGYRFQTVATQGSEFDRNTHGLYFKLAMPLQNPWLPGKDTMLQLSASWEFDDYANRSAIDSRGRRRDDLITSAGLVLSQLLRSDPRRGDLILHLIANWTDSDSDVRSADRATPFSYDKVVVGFQLQWRF